MKKWKWVSWLWISICCSCCAVSAQEIVPAHPNVVQAQSLLEKGDVEHAAKLLQQAVQDGDEQAYFQLAQLYRKIGSRRDWNDLCGGSALNCYQTARTLEMQLGALSRLSPPVQKAVSLILNNQPNQAMPLLLEAAEQPDRQAYYQLGHLFYRVDLTKQLDAQYLNDSTGPACLERINCYQKARYWLGKAAELGHVTARVLIGQMQLNAEGGPFDPQGALQIFQQVVEQAGLDNRTDQLSVQHGVTTAMFYLGRMYEAGLGVKADIAIARQWYQRAAQGWRLNGGDLVETSGSAAQRIRALNVMQSPPLLCTDRIKLLKTFPARCVCELEYSDYELNDADPYYQWLMPEALNSWQPISQVNDFMSALNKNYMCSLCPDKRRDSTTPHHKAALEASFTVSQFVLDCPDKDGTDVILSSLTSDSLLELSTIDKGIEYHNLPSAAEWRPEELLKLLQLHLLENQQNMSLLFATLDEDRQVKKVSVEQIYRQYVSFLTLLDYVQQQVDKARYPSFADRALLNRWLVSIYAHMVYFTEQYHPALRKRFAGYANANLRSARPEAKYIQMSADEWYEKAVAALTQLVELRHAAQYWDYQRGKRPRSPIVEATSAWLPEESYLEFAWLEPLIVLNQQGGTLSQALLIQLYLELDVGGIAKGKSVFKQFSASDIQQNAYLQALSLKIATKNNDTASLVAYAQAGSETAEQRIQQFGDANACAAQPLVTIEQLALHCFNADVVKQHFRDRDWLEVPATSNAEGLYHFAFEKPDGSRRYVFQYQAGERFATVEATLYREHGWTVEPVLQELRQLHGPEALKKGSDFAEVLYQWQLQKGLIIQLYQASLGADLMYIIHNSQIQ